MLQAACAIPATAALQEDCGLPLGLVAQPLARPEGAPSAAAAPPVTCWAADLARCARCGAYINALCEADDHGWACSLCGCGNDFSTAASLRRYYGVGSGRRAELPELAPGPLDALCPLVAADPDEGIEEVVAMDTAGPAVLALVDVCCGEEGLELVKSALAAAVEALPPGARFGLLSFGSQVGLHQPGDGGGLVAHVTLEGAEGATANLHEAAPLGAVLTSVGASKPAILAAIEALEAEPPVGGGTERMLGDALRAVLRWVAIGAQQAAEDALQERNQRQQGAQGQQGQQAQQAVAPQQQQWEQPAAQAGHEPTASGAELPAAQGFPGMRLLLFLSGPPNCGAGAAVMRQQQGADPAAAGQRQAAVEAAAKELAYLVLDPAYPELSAWTEGPSAEVRARAAAAAEAAAAAQAAAGDLSHAAPPGVPAESLAVDLSAAQFYAAAGAAAAALGISVDIFAAGPHWMGLEMIEPLASTTGGTLLLYGSLEAAALPQDVYKSVSQPRAFQCLLRLRTAPELEVRGAHGRLVPDSEHPNLWSLVCCGPDDAVAFSLDRSSTRTSCTANMPVQLVIQYSQLVPAAEGGGAAAAPGSRFVLHRFMRVLTTPLPLASQPAQLYASCDADATACLVVHKALETAADRGAAAARQMLFDWLVMLAARSADLLGGQRHKADASLAYIDQLAQLPHMLYALLRGPLLQAPAAAAAAAAAAPAAAEQPPQWQHPDFPAALRSLLRQLPPDELAVAVCPQLASWSSLDEVAVTHHSLSKAALAVAQQPLYVLDSFLQLIILYAANRAGSGSSSMDTALEPAAQPPYPPPATSTLRRTVGAIRTARRRTPELLMLRQGEGDTGEFDAWLIEDLIPAAAFVPSPNKWANFIEFLQAATRAAQEVLDRNR